MATEKKTTHSFQGCRLRNCVSLDDGAVPRHFPIDKCGVNVRLSSVGVDWRGIVALRETYQENFRHSLDSYLEQCFAKTNLRLSRSSVAGRSQHFILSTIKTPGLSRQQKTRGRTKQRRVELAAISEDDGEIQHPYKQPSSNEDMDTIFPVLNPCSSPPPPPATTATVAYVSSPQPRATRSKTKLAIAQQHSAPVVTDLPSPKIEKRTENVDCSSQNIDSLLSHQLVASLAQGEESANDPDPPVAVLSPSPRRSRRIKNLSSSSQQPLDITNMDVAPGNPGIKSPDLQPSFKGKRGGRRRKKQSDSLTVKPDSSDQEKAQTSLNQMVKLVTSSTGHHDPSSDTIQCLETNTTEHSVLVTDHTVDDCLPQSKKKRPLLSLKKKRGQHGRKKYPASPIAHSVPMDESTTEPALVGGVHSIEHASTSAIQHTQSTLSSAVDATEPDPSAAIHFVKPTSPCGVDSIKPDSSDAVNSVELAPSSPCAAHLNQSPDMVESTISSEHDQVSTAGTERFATSTAAVNPTDVKPSPPPPPLQCDTGPAELAEASTTTDTLYESCSSQSPPAHSTTFPVNSPCASNTFVPYLKVTPLSLKQLQQRLNSTYLVHRSPIGQLPGFSDKVEESFHLHHSADSPSLNDNKRVVGSTPVKEDSEENEPPTASSDSPLFLPKVSPTSNQPSPPKLDQVSSSGQHNLSTATYLIHSSNGSSSSDIEEEAPLSTRECDHLTTSSSDCLPATSTEEDDTRDNKPADTTKQDVTSSSAAPTQQRTQLFNLKGVELKGTFRLPIKPPKSFIPRNSPRRPETHEDKKQQLKEKMAKKKAEEEQRQRERALRLEQERLERIRKREEKMKRVHEKQAELQKVEEQKKRKIAGQRTKQEQLKEKLLQEQLKKKEERNQKQRERMLAAELRRKQEEESKKQKILKAEEERRMIEEVHRKRMEAEEEMKRTEAAEKERQRIREREAAEKEKEAELKKKREQQLAKEDQSKKPISADSVDKMLQHWKQQLDQRKAAIDTVPSHQPTALSSSFSSSSSCSVPVSSMPCSSSTVSSTTAKLPLPPLNSTFTKPTVSVAPVLNTPKPQTGGNSTYALISSYELTPADRNPLNEADNNYNISDISSDDSTDDESCPKKKVPVWAAPAAINQVMKEQDMLVHRDGSIPDHIFPPEELLLTPDLAVIFKKKRKRFYVRSSSAHWNSPLIKRSHSTNLSD